jgi:5-methylcytosine-specific restriction endonuclease McrA
MVTVSDLSDNALVGRVVQIRKQERSLLVEFLRCLIELDRRRTVLAMGFSSMFSFCVEQLGCSKAAAFRRTTAARLLSRFPLVADYLFDGRLNLTTLVELRDVLEESRMVEILDRAAGRTEDQVKELVAALRPQPAPSDLLRRLPTPRNDSGGSGRAPSATLSPSAAAVMPVVATPSPRPHTNPRARLEPIAPERHVLRVTVGAEFVADLEAVRAALSHQLPGASLEQVLHECMRVTLRTVEKRRRGTGKKATSKAPPPGSRYVPVAISDEVWRRDEGQCAFVGSTGRRCGSRHLLQLHHLDPSGKGGPTTAANISLRCRAHNLHAAEQDYGRNHIDRKIAASRARRRPPATEVLPRLW